MTPTDIQRLRALAEKATPGPWLQQDRTVYAVVHHGWYRGKETFRNRMDLHVNSDREYPAEAESTSAYIAALDPATVIALCDKALHPKPAQAQVSDATQRKLEIMGVALANISLGMHDHKEYAAQALHQAAQVEAAARARLSVPLPDGRS